MLINFCTLFLLPLNTIFANIASINDIYFCSTTPVNVDFLK